MSAVFYLQVLILMALPNSVITFLAIEANSIIIAFIGLLSTTVGAIGLVVVAQINSNANTKLIIGALSSSDDSRIQAALKLKNETDAAAAKVARMVVVAAEQPIPVEVVTTPDNPLPVEVVNKEEK